MTISVGQVHKSQLTLEVENYRLRAQSEPSIEKIAKKELPNEAFLRSKSNLRSKSISPIKQLMIKENEKSMSQETKDETKIYEFESDVTNSSPLTDSTELDELSDCIFKLDL